MRKNNKSSTLGLPFPASQGQLIEEFNSFIEMEVLDFYKHFIELNSNLSAEVDDFEILEENGKKFAVYTISVSTSLLNYSVIRRYSQFYELREKLIKNYQTLGIQSTPFPEKQLFGNLQPGTLNQRRNILNEFIKAVSMRSHIFPIIEFWEFLDVRARYSLEIRKQGVFQQDSFGFQSKSEETYMLFSFLEQLNREPFEITNILKEIDKFYSMKKPKLGVDMARALLLGTGRARGLLYFCGKYDKESDMHLSCSVGLPLLLSLMSYDYNKEAETFQEIFGSCKLKNLKDLNLEKHLIGETQKRCKQPALQLADIYINKNPTLDLETFFVDPIARHEFIKWKCPRQCNSRKTEKFQITDMNSPLTPPKQKRINFINIEKLLSPSSQRTHETEETSSSSPKNNCIKSEGFFEKLTEDRPSSWTKVPTKDADFCQIKHQSFVNIEFQIIVNARPHDCVCYFTEKLFWMSNNPSVSYAKCEDRDYYEKYVRFEVEETLDMKYVSFVTKVHVDEDENGVITIREKPLERKEIKLDEKEVLGYRSNKVTLTPVRNGAEINQTKIKIFIKNLDGVSIKFAATGLFREIGSAERSLYNLKSFVERKHLS